MYIYSISAHKPESANQIPYRAPGPLACKWPLAGNRDSRLGDLRWRCGFERPSHRIIGDDCQGGTVRVSRLQLEDPPQA